jgi:hypothetical protein
LCVLSGAVPAIDIEQRVHAAMLAH